MSATSSRRGGECNMVGARSIRSKRLHWARTISGFARSGITRLPPCTRVLSIALVYNHQPPINMRLTLELVAYAVKSPRIRPCSISFRDDASTGQNVCNKLKRNILSSKESWPAGLCIIHDE